MTNPQEYPKLTESQLVNIKDQFNAMDTDRDGTITESEFVKALENANRTPGDYDTLKFFSEADRNKDGKITLNEFVEALHAMGLTQPSSGVQGKKDPKEVDAIFRQFDADGNGYISAKELGAILASQGEHLTEDDLKRMINEADTNG
ncbi:calmodulin-like 3 [Actinomortierella ambigua]|uniref:Calmodulin-like 3 n=1 Tax=Actinomortierella ambigua TaxID=1343610 RepID=A0A9P6PXT2_9FUNG|nr:calmodulin-like 3 [Actinomortierella ambigua]KAG0256305.1 calmodulin-like 3 [Actinomortierella ambigua]